MTKTKKSKSRRRRERLFAEQQGICHWCGCVMQLFCFPPGQRVPPNACTVEHLESRNSALRYVLGERIVAACHKCNQDRNREELQLLAPVVVKDSAPANVKAPDPTTKETIAHATVRQCGAPGFVLQKRNWGQHWQGRFNGKVIAEWWPSNGRLVILGRHKERNYIHDETLFANVCVVIVEQLRGF